MRLSVLQFGIWTASHTILLSICTIHIIRRLSRSLASLKLPSGCLHNGPSQVAGKLLKLQSSVW